MTDDLEIRIIELPKYTKMKMNDKFQINSWLEFILNPERKGELKGMEEDDLIEEARRKWEEIISDKKIRDRALRREVAEFDRNTALKEATDEGFEQGMRCGVEQGIQKGTKQGIKQGKSKERKEIAKKMLESGSTKEYVEEITGLTILEIEEIIKEIE